MGRTIVIANQKGGVGKTTTAINLSASLAEAEKKVLVIDIDPQGNTTSGFGIEKDEQENTIYELLLGECEIEECMIVTEFDDLTIIPSNVNLAAAEIELVGIEEKEYILKKALDKVRDKYDFIIIDCAPIGMISDAIPVGNAVDGTIFAISSQDTNKKDAANCVKLLQRNNVNVLGSVLTKAKSLSGSHYYYY